MDEMCEKEEKARPWAPPRLYAWKIQKTLSLMRL